MSHNGALLSAAADITNHVARKQTPATCRHSYVRCVEVARFLGLPVGTRMRESRVLKRNVEAKLRAPKVPRRPRVIGHANKGTVMFRIAQHCMAIFAAHRAREQMRLDAEQELLEAASRPPAPSTARTVIAGYEMPFFPEPTSEEEKL